jgi:hypothetical protein
LIVPADDTSTELFDAARLRALLEELARRLAGMGVEARVYVVGGAALALAYYEEGERRLTNDVDATFFPIEAVSGVAEAIAEEHGLRTGWLSPHAGQFYPADGVPEGAPLMRRDGVEIVVGPARLILAMKLRAARLGRDNDDIAVLIRRCDIRSVHEAVDVLDETYGGEEMFKPVARAIVEAALLEYEVRSARPPFTLPPMPPRNRA